MRRPAERKRQGDKVNPSRMTLKAMLIALLPILLADSVLAETLTWEAIVPRGPGLETIARGVKTYTVEKDIIIRQRPEELSGSDEWSKTLVLDDTFALTAVVTRDQRLEGFGFAIERRGDPNGFSWEWFDRATASVFQRRQGTGRVSVTFAKGPDYEELQSVEFLDDIPLRYLDDMKKPPGTHTIGVIIRKGGVLRLAR